MVTCQGGAGQAGLMSLEGLSGLVNRIIAWADRLQRRHGVLGFPYAVVKKYGDDEGGRSTRPSMRSAMRPGTALCRPMKGCRLHEHRP